MMRKDHYQAAEELLADFDGSRAYEPDIPDLLRALAHAVLASADLEVEPGNPALGHRAAGAELLAEMATQ